MTTTATSPPGDGGAQGEPGAEGPTGPAGWHGDPWQRHQLRFFDGRLWSEHVSDGGVAGLDSEPVADLARSRPAPERAAPPEDPIGARVLRADGARGGTPAPPTGQAPLLLVATAPDDDGTRPLRHPDDSPAGSIVTGPPRLLARAGRLLVATPSTVVTRLRVRDGEGEEMVRLSRPWRRTAPVVDVSGPGGRLGTVTAEKVLREVRARVEAADGRPVGVLSRAEGTTASLAVVADDGATLARLTPVWDVPGARRHLPPGVLLLDRRPRPGQPFDAELAALLLGAVLAPELLRPPPAPSEGR